MKDAVFEKVFSMSGKPGSKFKLQGWWAQRNAREAFGETRRTALKNLERLEREGGDATGPFKPTK